MSKFKIGDRVRAKRDNGWVEAGAIGIVAENDDVPYVDWANGKRLAVPESKMDLAYTPAVGDWVRLTADSDMWGKAGDVGRVIAREDKGERLEFVEPVHGGGAWLVPVNKLEAWAPKVGERVRFRDMRNGRAPFGERGENLTVVDVRLAGGSIDLLSSYSGCRFTSFKSDLEPLPVAAPQPAAQEPALVIQAGKFYRTRDGRKVLVEHNQHYDRTKTDGYPWKHDDGCGGYHGLTKLGTSCIGRSDKDLIAEWQETTNVGAQVDTLAEEYGPAPTVAVASNDNTAKPKFKVGDIVMDTASLDRNRAVVERVLGDRIEIRWVDGGHAGKWPVHDFELAQPTAIVALIEDGQPKPADIPHVHASQAAAEREAKRLAGVHKGKQFGVYVLATTAEEPAPVYAHEWQRLAVKGRKIDAIVKLNGLTGIGIKPARDAVEYFLAAA